MNHRWRTRKGLGSYLFCSTCGADEQRVGTDSECLIAVHADPEINALYVARRDAARNANESGWKGIHGWQDLEEIQAKLTELDPEGDWYFEGDRWDGRGWRVERPDPETVEPMAGGEGKWIEPESIRVDDEHDDVIACIAAGLTYEGHIAAPGYGVAYVCSGCGRPWTKLGDRYVDPREVLVELRPEDVR